MFQNHALHLYDETYAIIGAAMRVHNQLGNGYSEIIYLEALEREFAKSDIPYQREVQIKVLYDGVPLTHFYAADFICFGKVVVETKAVWQLVPANRNQVTNYLKATNLTVGLLINFGSASLEYKRFFLQE